MNSLGRQSYDERSILDPETREDGGGSFFEETFSTVSSQLTTTSNPNGQKRRIRQWKQRMGRSIRRLLGRDSVRITSDDDDDDDANGLFVLVSDEAVYPFPKNYNNNNNKTSFRDLAVPSFNASQEDSEAAVSTDALCHAGDEFPLQPWTTRDTSGLTAATTKSFLSDQQDFSPSKSSLFVSFDEDCAQLVFEADDQYDGDADNEDNGGEEDEDAADDDDNDDREQQHNYLPDDLHSVVSGMHSLVDTDDDAPRSISGRPLGARFAHPACTDSLLMPCPSTDTEFTEPGGPLGIQCGHPHWYSHQEQQSAVDALWSQVSVPALDGEVTDPPSPIKVPTRYAQWGGLAPSDSSDSDITISEALHPQAPTSRYSPCVNDDENESEAACPPNPWGKLKKPEEHPYDEVEYGMRRRSNAGDTLNNKIDRFVRETLGYSQQQQQQQKHREAAKENYPPESRDVVATQLAARRKCNCIKCAAKSIYQDLMSCNNGGRVDW